MSEIKEKVLKAAREEEPVTYRQTPVRLLADFSVETAGWKGVA